MSGSSAISSLTGELSSSSETFVTDNFFYTILFGLVVVFELNAAVPYTCDGYCSFSILSSSFQLTILNFSRFS